jgi:hypothetical protein
LVAIAAIVNNWTAVDCVGNREKRGKRGKGEREKGDP